MTSFVGNHANDLIGRFALHERAGVDEDVASVDDEGVEDSAPHDPDRDTATTQPGGPEDRPCIVVHEPFDFGIANEREPLRFSLSRGRCKHSRQSSRSDQTAATASEKTKRSSVPLSEVPVVHVNALVGEFVDATYAIDAAHCNRM